jgi:hypothetical protein
MNPPRPRSSVSACTTTARPRMLWAPMSEISESWNENCATPVLSAWIFPKSPACLFSSLGPPCFFCEEKSKRAVYIWIWKIVLCIPFNFNRNQLYFNIKFVITMVVKIIYFLNF